MEKEELKSDKKNQTDQENEEKNSQEDVLEVNQNKKNEVEIKILNDQLRSYENKKR